MQRDMRAEDHLDRAFQRDLVKHAYHDLDALCGMPQTLTSSSYNTLASTSHAVEIRMLRTIRI